MRAGLLNEIIELKRPSVTKNAYGEKVIEYPSYYTTKARVIYGGGNRTQENGEILFNYSLTFEVYDYVDVTETDQVSYNAKLYRILSIEHNKKQMKKVIRVEEINE